MRVLVVTAGEIDSSYGGGQVYIKNLIRNLKLREEHYEILTIIDSHGNGTLQKYDVSEIEGLRLHKIYGKISTGKIREIIRNISPDVVHAHSHKSLISEVCPELKIPTVVTCHHGGLVCPEGSAMTLEKKKCPDNEVSIKNCLRCCLHSITGGSWFYPILRIMPESILLSTGELLKKLPFIKLISPVGLAAIAIKEKKEEWNRIKEKTDIIISPSKSTEDFLVSNGLNPKKSRIVAHGIPLPTNKPDFPPIKEKILFYSLGRLNEVKGIEDIIEAFRIVGDQRIELHIIGEAVTKREKRYALRLRKLGKGDSRIIFHGKINPEDVFEFIRNFHVLIAPSNCLEVFGLNIAEALAMGKPVISTMNGGAEMQITPGRNGWIVAQHSPGELAMIITSIIKNPDILKTFSKNCKAIPIEQHLDRLSAIYRELSEKKNEEE